LFSGGNTCKSPSDTTPGKCDNRKTQSFLGNITAVPRQHFSLSTPIAKNDCDAHYVFGFKWASPHDPEDPNMPPMYDLAQAFRHEDEFAYFPHSNPVRSHDNSGYKWTIDFTTGNRNSGFTNTRYGIETFLDSQDPTAQVFIVAAIDYTPYQ
jgi:hypothetical protein